MKRYHVKGNITINGEQYNHTIMPNPKDAYGHDVHGCFDPFTFFSKEKSIEIANNLLDKYNKIEVAELEYIHDGKYKIPEMHIIYSVSNMGEENVMV